MIVSAATLGYETPAAIVFPVVEKEYQTARADGVLPEKPSASATTIEYAGFASHFSKLRRLQTEPSLWPVDAERPSTESLAWAQAVLRQLVGRHLSPTRIVASVEGGTAICFVDGKKYADIESLNSGVILGVLSDKRGRPIVWEVEPNARGITRAVDRIRAFIDPS